MLLKILDSTRKIRIFNSKLTNPYYNLALEEWLLKDNKDLTLSLLLYRNEPSVILGRSQNPWVECNLPQLAKDNVNLVRRQSGGGCVFHDLGNSNYHIMVPQATFHRRTNASLVSGALNKMNISTFVNERNDIMFDRFKVSGSAFKISNSKAYHHGTMLIDTDLKGLKKYLNSEHDRIEAKGVASVRSQVTNLKEVNSQLEHSNFVTAVIDKFREFYQCENIEVENIDSSFISNQPKIQQYADTLRSWTWTFGQTPQFTKTCYHPQLPIEFKITVYNGRIKSCQLESPHLDLIENQQAIDQLLNDRLLDQSLFKYLELEDQNLKDGLEEDLQTYKWIFEEVRKLIV